MDNALVARIFNATTGVWTLVAAFISTVLVAWVRSRPGLLERANERRRDAAAATAGDFQRLREEVMRLSDRVKALEDKVEECEKDRDEWRTRAVTAESELIRLQAFEHGYGEARQTAQTILSTERASDRKKK